MYSTNITPRRQRSHSELTNSGNECGNETAPALDVCWQIYREVTRNLLHSK